MCIIYQGYLQEISETLRERAADAKWKANQGQGIAEKISSFDFQRGVLMGYYEVLSAMVSQAKAFDIPLEAIGLADCEPDQLISA